ncbi:hypothetical protein D187_008315 [Cystobacter fuscus DSM 2262]|uniref:Uncharacterized protein n=1 Tax=Cystobacter fuscus (strain ATCC 25194 / DSM 2262 / NBRC 100088 / M29) TaxID=1242864 RepID=S9Q357_CYSF2|nr:hypothetical protein [Cystobacter fuscus]EPX55754.1 hypothetical protein D187_008315 [Cystobacter fuscus DSM 2262]
MRWRGVLTFTAWMAMGMGYPDTWREGGTIDRAMAEDLSEEMHRHDCYLSEEEWKKRCRVPPEEWNQSGCPHACQFRADP